jgi:hypothetical protein
MIEVTYHGSTVQNLVQNGCLVVIVLMLCCSVSSDRTDTEFFVDTQTTLTSISPAPCHLQTKHRFGSVKLPSRNASVVVVVAKATTVATAQLALLLHHVKQRRNKLSSLMLLRKHLNNLLWMHQWLRTLPQLM